MIAAFHAPYIGYEPYIGLALAFGALCMVASLMRRHARDTAEPLPSRADQLRGLPTPSPLNRDWVYMRLYYAAKDSLETGEPMAQVNVRTEDLVNALYRMGGKGAVES